MAPTATTVITNIGSLVTNTPGLGEGPLVFHGPTTLKESPAPV